MAPDQLELVVALDEPDDAAALRQRAAEALGVSRERLPALQLLKRSLDARRRHVRHRLLFRVGGEAESISGPPELRQVSDPERVLIIGGGPAGLFCAYQLARLGIGSTVLERGKPVQPRRHDLKALNRHGVLSTDSNYCFGEGGAGTYSDGKLYTRSHKRGGVRDVLQVLVRCGAPEEILTEARPHIGSNRLPRVVTALRVALEAAGVRFRFGARVTELVRQGERVTGVRLQGGEELSAARVVLATGHSASDVYRMLWESGLPLEAKPFAVGVRVEHPQPLIDRIQYGAHAGHPRLGSAAYRLAHEVDGRGVFSFCMCPGGFIVPAATEPGRLVVNGMSLKRRSSPFANSGLVVQVEQEDVARAAAHLGLKGDAPLWGLEVQGRLEAAAFQAGGGAFVAPAVRVTDFIAGRASARLGDTSYIPGLTSADLGAVLDGAGLDLSRRLRRALTAFDGQLRGYVTEEAQLIGVESRTSSPVRVPRHPETLQARSAPGLFPCGEGAGYAGGIMSAAVDGLRVAEALALSLGVTSVEA
ncbi:MAG: FAD-dependent oxidoreductase [Polyangiaceae bacterium]|nr:FAD-dependent oxidoreductase [Polyangiaceae bacterium]MCW5788935.1 FAD-dependent oxidoreductase [Polyangiaceae bacterium]